MAQQAREPKVSDARGVIAINQNVALRVVSIQSDEMLRRSNLRFSGLRVRTATRGGISTHEQYPPTEEAMFMGVVFEP